MPDRTELLENLREALPVTMEDLDLDSLGGCVELVVIDAVKGFTTKGALADPASMSPMVEEVDRLAMRLIRTLGGRLHISMFRDIHYPDVPEPPYAPHCCIGTEECDFDDRLAWLGSLSGITQVFDKDCIDGVIGSFRVMESDRVLAQAPYHNSFLEHMRRRQPKTVIVVGDCTDICISDFVTSLLSARNHGLMSYNLRSGPSYIRDIQHLSICVYEPACATFDADPDEPSAIRHPKDIAHHVGLWNMANRGAKILRTIR